MSGSPSTKTVVRLGNSDPLAGDQEPNRPPSFALLVLSFAKGPGAKLLIFMVRPSGFEPPTFCSGGKGPMPM